MRPSNRRTHKRLRLPGSVRIPIQIFPVLPFLGEEVSARLHNLSLGGLSLVLHKDDIKCPLKKGMRIKIHIRLPGEPLQGCMSTVASHTEWDEIHIQLGLQFVNLPGGLRQLIDQMVRDDQVQKDRLEFSLQTVE